MVPSNVALTDESAPILPMEAWVSPEVVEDEVGGISIEPRKCYHRKRQPEQAEQNDDAELAQDVRRRNLLPR